MSQSREPALEELKLSEEEYAIKQLKKVLKKFPKTLLIYAGSHNGLSIRRIPTDGTFYNGKWEVAHISGVKQDGGDGGDYD